MLNVTIESVFLQMLVSLIIIIPTYIKVTNFIATPSWEMNEIFKLPTKHDML
jgi:heme/copper-type cytochrome/quinol oxidase subunit 1